MTKPAWYTPEGQRRALSGPNPDLPPGHVQVRPFEANGFTRLENREGGTEPLWVAETSPGVYVSTWATFNKAVRRAMKANQCKMAMTIVVDTNVPGHPSISVCLQPFKVIPDRTP
jgi:hypothetical protein